MAALEQFFHRNQSRHPSIIPCLHYVCTRARGRIIKSFTGLAVAFSLCLIFALDLWRIISRPARAALLALGINPPDLISIARMEQFSVIYMSVPLTASLFLAAPWVLYQAWAFISPGLYQRERRWAVPFVLTTAGLFIAGGLFAYFVVFRSGLTFLLGIALGDGVRPFITISEYFDMFFNVTVGIALVFELPVLILFLTLLRIVSPRFLLSHSRYAILAIVIVAAVVTPTPDYFNLLLFATPMCALYFVGVLASYLLILRRDGQRFPWRPVLLWTGLLLLAAASGTLAAMKWWHVFRRPR